MPKKTKKNDLPDSIIPIECADKEGWSEKWDAGRNMLNFPHPWRGVFCGLPSSGKSTYIKNIIIRTQPHFEEIIVSGFDNEKSKEWDAKAPTLQKTNWHPPGVPVIDVAFTSRLSRRLRSTSRQ